MTHTFRNLSDDIVAAVDRAAASVVQVYAHRRPTAGVVFAPDLVAAPARALGDDTAVVRLSNGTTVEGQVLGHAHNMGLGVIRVSPLGVPACDSAPEPRVGSLAVAVGRTWSGAVMATVTNVAVVGGPLRTGRATQLDRVIRISQPPHGALTGGALVNAEGHVLGVITGAAIRGTTVVVPTTLAWDAMHQIVKRGGTRQGYLGISTTPVALPRRQRAEAAEEFGLLITTVADDSPADAAGLFVGDIVVRFEGHPVQDPESLITLLRGDRIGNPVTVTVMRGLQRQDVVVTPGERPTRRGRS
jgi:S1-C subfamily serine protease